MSEQLSLDNTLPDLSYLTQDERKMILDVLNRDDIIQKNQSEKIIQLRQEIDILESKSIDLPTEHIATATICVRCKQSFGYFYFYNQGDFCPKCHYKVCQSCQVTQENNSKNKWLCLLCHKYNQYLVKTGTWIHSQQEQQENEKPLKKNTLRKDSLTGSQIIKLTLLPEKKNEILGEIKNTQTSKSTLSRTCSILKPKNRKPIIDTQSLKQNCSSQSIASLNDSSSQSSSNLSFIQSTVKISPVEVKTLSVITDPILLTPKTKFSFNIHQQTLSDTKRSPHRPIIYNTPISRQISNSTIIDQDTRTPRNIVDKQFQFNMNDKKEVAPKATIDNDLDSVTSSEMDNLSSVTEDKTGLPATITDSSAIIKPKTSDTNPYSIKALARCDRDESISRCSFTSSASKNQISDVDDSLLQMDQLFARAKQSIEDDTAIDKTSEMNLETMSTSQIQTISPISERKSNKFRSLSSHMSMMRKSSKQKKFERTTSVKSVAYDYDTDLEIKGRVLIKFDYEKKSSNLNVRIIKCEDLVNIANKPCDSYVKIYLIPGNKDKNSNKRKTSIKKASNNPEFNETLRYVLGHIELFKNKIWISVWHSDKFGRNKFMGEFSVQLNPQILSEKEPTWFNLMKRTLTE